MTLPRTVIGRLVVRRRATTAAVVLAALVALATVGCTDDGDRDAFCERIAETPALGDTLGALDASDPGGAKAQLEEAARQFRLLEGDAPGSIKEDVARLRRGVDVILDAVQAHPDDLSAARAAIAGQQQELVGLASAAADVVAYARDECGVGLDGLDGSGGLTPPTDGAGSTDEIPATSDAATSSTGG